MGLTPERVSEDFRGAPFVRILGSSLSERASELVLRLRFSDAVGLRSYQIYVNGVPGGISLVVVATPFSMAFASTPQLPVKLMLAPAASSIAFGGFLYIFVMPAFSTFEELGLLIFTVTFAICYFFILHAHSHCRTIHSIKHKNICCFCCVRYVYLYHLFV